MNRCKYMQIHVFTYRSDPTTWRNPFTFSPILDSPRFYLPHQSTSPSYVPPPASTQEILNGINTELANLPTLILAFEAYISALRLPETEAEGQAPTGFAEQLTKLNYSRRFISCEQRSVLAARQQVYQLATRLAEMREEVSDLLDWENREQGAERREEKEWPLFMREHIKKEYENCAGTMVRLRKALLGCHGFLERSRIQPGPSATVERKRACKRVEKRPLRRSKRIAEVVAKKEGPRRSRRIAELAAKKAAEEAQ